jgi:hypothetical protein
MKKESIHDSPPEQQVELSLDVAPSEELSSEKIMFAVGCDYHAQLEAYGSAVNHLRHALVGQPAPWGWWSWTAYYFGLSESTARVRLRLIHGDSCEFVSHFREYFFALAADHIGKIDCPCLGKLIERRGEAASIHHLQTNTTN